MKAAVVSQLLFYIILPLAGSSDVRPSQKGDLPILIPKQPEIDAISSLGSGARNEDTTFKEAIQLLDSLNSSPSCNRIAATRLVVSCQAFSGGKDGTHADSPETMDLVRSIYAARLAICEIEGAGAAIPPSCLPVTVSPPPQKSRFGFVSRHKSSDNVSDKMPREVLEDCLRAIESRPQWWTSYSNSRQNALVICQASRVETEKEELLDLHRSIAKGSLKLNSGIRDALRDAVAQSEQQQLFMEAVQVLQEKIVMDMEQTDSLFQRTFGNFLREIELGIGCLQNSISSALFSLRTGTEVLEKDIHNVSSQVGALQQALQTVQQDALARNQEATLVQESNAIAHGNLAASLHLSLESLLDSDMVRIYRGMQKFDAAMEWLTSRMNMILEQETRMAERLHTMETFMHQSESKASELQTAQEQQTEALAAHSRTQEAIQFHAQVSQALLNKANIAAANLQSIIDDAAIKYKSGPGLRIEGYSAWSLCGILLLIIAAQNFKVAISLLFLILAHSMAPTILPFF
ncbi:uncharacterized protein N7446_006926 [Penicillium canescens]|uniref:uncharacterized protein n=1 Tax=Penicillium canescens TaxID=5083 RepID=UPI0026E0BD72|nr:uncharacterized protein N7446_006926 [Penicillium canescens]KAJ6062806.1 hypothetical protein N7446_006926 [Penicillium canescens]